MKKYFYVTYSLNLKSTGQHGVGATTITSTSEEPDQEPEFLIKDAAEVIKKLLPQDYSVLILSWKEITKLQKDEFNGIISSSGSGSNNSSDNTETQS